MGLGLGLGLGLGPPLRLRAMASNSSSTITCSSLASATIITSAASPGLGGTCGGLVKICRSCASELPTYLVTVRTRVRVRARVRVRVGVRVRVRVRVRVGDRVRPAYLSMISGPEMMVGGRHESPEARRAAR